MIKATTNKNAAPWSKYNNKMTYAHNWQKQKDNEESQTAHMGYPSDSTATKMAFRRPAMRPNMLLRGETIYCVNTNAKGA